jgi:hypothetical protein
VKAFMAVGIAAMISMPVLALTQTTTPTSNTLSNPTEEKAGRRYPTMAPRA